MRTGRPVGGGFVVKLIGSCKPPFTGGGIALLSSAFEAGPCFFEELFDLRFDRELSSGIVSLSSASEVLMLGAVPLVVTTSAALDLVRGRLVGALAASFFLCFTALVTL